MVRARVTETDHGIEGTFTVAAYDEFQRHMRDRGWIETGALLKADIRMGRALEIGPGPGYLGLEWLKKTEGTSLVGVEISADMIDVARRNARDYGLGERADYVQGSGGDLPLPEASVDAVFTAGLLHEWERPGQTFDEMWRVLRPGGLVFLSDLRRDMLLPLRWFLWLSCRPKAIRPGLLTSLRASYTPGELRELVQGTGLASCRISPNPLGFTLTGRR
jgi:ubiquinone/menaquinone biosynthesis C-methylase UbiE